MADDSGVPLRGLPDGQAEVCLVLHLRWEDVAALGQEAGRLAARLQRSVSLDEAASYRLGGRSSFTVPDRTASAPGGAGASSGESGRRAVEKVNGAPHGVASTAGGVHGGAPTAVPEAGGVVERSVRPGTSMSVAGVGAQPPRATA